MAILCRVVINFARATSYLYGKDNILHLMSNKKTNTKEKVRPPVIVVMGHIDHGKSTLLDYIRESNVAEAEAGGITQHTSAYEVEHEHEGEKRGITFIDTPGHEAFQAMRSRGAEVADIAILVVAADDGVKPQTLEAYKAIQAADIPLVVALNKIDKPDANTQMAITSLIENEIYLEGSGGDIPFTETSAKTGKGIEDLLSTLLLVADLEELSADPEGQPTGIVIESTIDPKRGTQASLIIKNGTFQSGMHAVAGRAYSPIRIMEDFTGKTIKEATFSAPITIVGFDNTPQVGDTVLAFEARQEAKDFIASSDTLGTTERRQLTSEITIPVVIKSDVAGTIDAITYEIDKLSNEEVGIDVVNTGVGAVSESDIRAASGFENVVVVGFNVEVEPAAQDLADRQGVSIATFSIIYELIQFLEEVISNRLPTSEEVVETGQAHILRFFSKQGNKQIIGGRMAKGYLKVGETVRIFRRKEEIAQGEIRGLQQQRVEKDKIESGEFGMEIEAPYEIAPGDILVGLAEEIAVTEEIKEE